MKRKKIIIDALFIVLSAIILIVLNDYGVSKKHLGFALIPILIAYYLGQFVEKKIRLRNTYKYPEPKKPGYLV